VKAVILAAGRGSRFGAMTETVPKCMLHFAGKPILHHQLDLLASYGIDDVSIVKGYLGDALVAPDAKVYWNREYASSNMVESLFAAEEALNGGVIVTYADILYDSGFLETVLASNDSDIGVAVDMRWRDYYEARFDDPFTEAESLIMTTGGMICDIGRSSPSCDDVMAQYVGVIKLNDAGCVALRHLYQRLKGSCPEGWHFRGRRLSQLYMTDLLQLLIDHGIPVYGIPVANGWLEFDSQADLAKAHRWWSSGQLQCYFRGVERGGAARNGAS